MAQIICNKCSEILDTNDNAKLAKVGLIGGVLLGAVVGGGIGIAGAFGGIGGSIPLAVIIGTFGWLLLKKLHACPHCQKKIIV